jgi:hypothetical protein
MRIALRAAAAASLTLATALAVLASGGVPARAQAPAPVMTPVPPMSPAPIATPMPMMTPALASPSPSPSPSASSPPENTLVTARVRDEFDAWQRGRIDRKNYSPYAGGTYIDAFVAQVQPDLAAAGAVVSLQYRTASLLLGDVVYRYDVVCSTGVFSVLYSLDPQGKTDGIEFTPQIFRSTSISQ